MVAEKCWRLFMYIYNTKKGKWALSSILERRLFHISFSLPFVLLRPTVYLIDCVVVSFVLFVHFFHLWIH
jgi:hypothetical protein